MEFRAAGIQGLWDLVFVVFEVWGKLRGKWKETLLLLAQDPTWVRLGFASRI